MNYGFISYFLEIMLHEHFHSKRAMARELDLQLRTIQINFKRLNSPKGAGLAFERSICYCYAHGISVDGIYAQYNLALKKGAGLSPILNHALLCIPTLLQRMKNFSSLPCPS